MITDRPLRMYDEHKALVVKGTKLSHTTLNFSQFRGQCSLMDQFTHFPSQFLQLTSTAIDPPQKVKKDIQPSRPNSGPGSLSQAPR